LLLKSKLGPFGLAAAAVLALVGCLPPAPGGNLNLPAPATPLESAWVELIEVQEEQFQMLASVHNESQAEAAAGSAVEYHKKRFAALKKIAELGGEKPPIGVPEKYRAEYKAVEDRLLARDEVVSQMISPDRREQLNQQLRQALQSDPELAKDPFELSAEIRTAGAGNTVTVTLVNNQSLQGPLHQQMIARLQQLAGASSTQSVIEDDGTYKVVLAPVGDFGGFVKSIHFGDVSNRDDSARTFTLTIDPQKFQAFAGPGAAGPSGGATIDPRTAGRPPGFGGPGAGAAPGGRPSFGPPSGSSDQQKADFFARNGGMEKCVTLVLENAPRAAMPESQVLIAAAKQIAGARSTFYLRTGGQQLLLLAPVEDIDALAGKIDFGKVTGHDAAKREIYVKIESTASSP
jgi:hypothetical protein